MRAALSEITSEFSERDFFRDKFTADELRVLAADRPVSDIFASRSPSVKKYGLEPASMSDEQMLEWMAREPRLLRRPLLVVDDRLIVQPHPKSLGEIVG